MRDYRPITLQISLSSHWWRKIIILPWPPTFSFRGKWISILILICSSACSFRGGGILFCSNGFIITVLLEIFLNLLALLIILKLKVLNRALWSLYLALITFSYNYWRYGSDIFCPAIVRVAVFSINFNRLWCEYLRTQLFKAFNATWRVFL